MLKKRKSKQKNKVTVTFTLPSEFASESLRLAGDFTDWEPSRAFKRQKDGSWRTSVELGPGREYQFRYLADGHRWVNEPEADRYVPNPYGEQNSIVVT